MVSAGRSRSICRLPFTLRSRLERSVQEWRLPAGCQAAGPGPREGMTMTSTELDPGTLAQMYRRMRLIRRFEEQASALYRDSRIPGFLHLSIGQEASAVGACWPLEDRDVITSTHRGH